jgi:HlyD family secretion protein
MKKAIWMRIVFLLAALGAGGFIVFIALRPTPLRVETARVECGPLRVTIDAEGKTRVHDRFVVAAPVTGRLARIIFHRGDVVESNAVVARIDPLPLAPLDPRQHAEANARVAAAQAIGHEAAALVERARRL